MSDSDWGDLVSVLPIKNQHLPKTAVEDTAYSSWLPDINSMFPSSCLHFSNSFFLSPAHKNTLAICQSLWPLFFAAVNYLVYNMAPLGVSGLPHPLSLAPCAGVFWWQTSSVFLVLSSSKSLLMIMTTYHIFLLFFCTCLWSTFLPLRLQQL